MKNVRPQDLTRMLENLKKVADWKGRLISANDLFNQGSSQYSAAVNQYGKIIDLLLRELCREMYAILPPKEKANFPQIEDQIAGGNPFGDFTLGQSIDFFSKTGLFQKLNALLGGAIFDDARLRAVNNYRVDQTHYDKKIEKLEVDNIRKDITDILLGLKLIEKDPEEVIVAKTSDKNMKANQKEHLEDLQRMIIKIRCGLLNNSAIQFWEHIDRQDGWSGEINVEAEITGVYMDSDERIVLLVRVLELETPEGEEDTGYDIVGKRVRDIIAKIAPELKEKIRILYFVESEGGFEGSADVISDSEGSVEYS